LTRLLLPFSLSSVSSEHEQKKEKKEEEPPAKRLKPTEKETVSFVMTIQISFDFLTEAQAAKNLTLPLWNQTLLDF
jgi:hypothetical protein